MSIHLRESYYIQFHYSLFRVLPTPGIEWSPLSFIVWSFNQDFDTCSVHYRASVCNSGVLNSTLCFSSSSKVSIHGYGGAAMPVCWLPAWCTCGSGSTIVTGLNETVRSSVRYSPRMSSSWALSASLLSSSEGHLGPLFAGIVILLLLPVPHVIAGHVPLVK